MKAITMDVYLIHLFRDHIMNYREAAEIENDIKLAAKLG